MAASLLGEAAVRVVPTLRGFRTRVRTELERTPMHFDVDIRPKVDTSVAKKQLEKFRKTEEADAIELKARIDEADFKRQFQRVEHVFERSAFAKALRLQVKIIGADALYALAGAAGAAATALQSVAGAALIIPGALAQAGVAAGVLALAFNDIGKAMTAVQTAQDQTADKARALSSAQADGVKAARDVARAQKDVGKAVRDTIRNMEDLAHAVRGTSLNEADALLNVQESFDKLKEGGFKSITELRRAQLGLAQDLHRLDEVRTQNTRTVQDFNQAQAEGVQGSDQVVNALDAVADAQNRVADAANRMADAQQTKLDTGAFARLAPSAQEFVLAVTDVEGAWVSLGNTLQQQVFLGQAQNMIDTITVSVKNFGPALTGVADELNGVFKDIGGSLRSDTNQGLLAGIIGDTRNTIAELRQGINPAIEGILRLADAGGNKMPALMNVVNGFLDRFNAWTQRVSESGQLSTWIDQGITGFTQMVNISEDLIVTVFAIADAWKVAGGESTGLIGNAENVAQSLRDWATSASGQGGLVTNFKRIREWLGQMVDAFKDMWPTIKDIGQTLREWSVTFFTVLGYAFRLTSWVEEHTGLVKILVAAYISFRTIKPIWDSLINAAKMYETVMMRMSTMGGATGTFARNGVQGLSNMQTAMGKTGTAAQTMASTFGVAQSTTSTAIQNTGRQAQTVATGPLTRLQSAFMNMVTPINSTAGQIRSLTGFLPAASNNMAVLGDKATAATKQVGGGPAGKVGLFGAAAGLAAFMGPGLAFTAAIAGAMIAIDKLGESHRNAATDALNQKAALDSLKSSLDQFTGFANPQHMINTANTLRQFDVPGSGKVDILKLLQDNPNLGLDPQRAIALAGDPQRVKEREAEVERLRGLVVPEIEANEQFQKVKGALEDRSVTADTIAKAITGDAESHAKLYEAFKEGNIDLPDWLSNAPGMGVVANLGEFVQGVKFEDLLRSGGPAAQAALALQNTGAANWGQAQQNQQNTNLVTGNHTLRPGNSFAPFGPDLGNVKVTPNGEGQVILNRAPDPATAKQWADMGWTVSQPDTTGRVQVTVPPEIVANQFQGLASGGMVRGRGSGTSDSNIVAASRGEFVVRKQAVDAVGVHTLDAINRGRLPMFNVGGLPFPVPLKPASPLPPPPPGPLPQASGENWQDLMLPPRPPIPHTPGPLDAVINGPRPAAPAPAAPKPPTTAGPPAVLPKPPGVTTPPAPENAAAGQPHGATASTTPGIPTFPGPNAPSGATSPYLPASGPVAVNPLTGMPSRFPNIYSGLKPNTAKALSAIEAAFPEITEIGGVRADALKWHPNGLALDIMIPGGDTHGGANPEGKALGDRIYAWMQQNAGALGIDMNASLWQTDQGGNHFNHVHLATNEDGSSTGGGLMLPGGLQQLIPYGPGASTDLSFLNGAGGSGYNDSDLPLADRIAKRYEDALKPENVNKFLLGQVENVGSSLLAIGTTFLQGITGIDLSGVMGHAQSVISHFTGSGSDSKNGSSSSPIPGLDNAVGANLNSFFTGDGTAAASGFDPMAGVDLNSILAQVQGSSAGVGGAVAGPGNASQKAIFDYIIQKAKSLGYNDQQALWFATQAMGESHLNPNANGGNQDGSGDVMGIFQFTPGTWGNRPGSPADPKRNIDEYFNLAKERGLTPENFTDPTQLGTQVSKGGPYHPDNAAKGHRANAEAGIAGLLAGKATGGPAGGLIRISRGEYRMGPKAVAKYGAGFMHRINSFARGGLTTEQDPRAQLQQPRSGSPLPSIMSGIQEGAGMAGGYIQQGLAENGIQLPGFAYGGLPTGAVINPRPIIPPKPPTPPPVQAKPMIPRPAPPRPAAPQQPKGPVIAPQRPAAPKAPAPAPHVGAGAPPGPPSAPGVPAPAPGPVAPATTPPPGAERSLSMLPGAPTRGSGDYLNPALRKGFEEGFAHAGALAGAAAGGAMGGMGIPGGGAASMMIGQAGQVAGKVASGIANVASAALIGNLTEIGLGPTPSGVPLLPEVAPQSFGQLPSQQQMAPQASPVGQRGPMIMNQYFGGIHTSNMDEWNRRRQLLERQQEQPLTNAFVH